MCQPSPRVSPRVFPTLRDAPSAFTEDLRHHIAEGDDPITLGAQLATTLATALPLPGEGRTAHLWAALAHVAAANLTVARVLEPPLDAHAILSQAGIVHSTSELWGVFAAEGAGHRLCATGEDKNVVLAGSKPWCSLATQLDSALVTAWVDETRRGLFAVDMRSAGVTVTQELWTAHGLAHVVSTPVRFDAVAATAVGSPGWYLERPGFAWGGIGVAAIWYGAACAVARLLLPTPQRTPDQLALYHLGVCAQALHGARLALLDAAAVADQGAVGPQVAAECAALARGVVATACETVMRHVDHGCGPGPLVSDVEHAARVADLHLYLRQWHAERDQAALGRLLCAGADT